MKQGSCLPNFLVIGAAKSGTTSLYDYLKQHPEVYLPRNREPSFFAHEGDQMDYHGPGDEDWDFTTDIASYQDLFREVQGEKAAGEISPRYLFFNDAAQRIRHYIPQTKLIAILRNPVDRAYSHFLMNIARNCEPIKNLGEAVKAEKERDRLKWSWDWQYTGLGLYEEQLSRYDDFFSSGQILVILFDDFSSHPEASIKAIFNFLGVDENFKVDMSQRQREAHLPKHLALNAWIERPNPQKQKLSSWLPKGVKVSIKAWLKGINRTEIPPLDSKTREELIQIFKPDILALQKRLNQDLSSWLV